MHVHNDLVRGLVQNVIGGAPPPAEEEAAATGGPVSVADAVAMLQREEGSAEGVVRSAAGSSGGGQAGAGRKRPLAEMAGAGVGSDSDSNSEGEEEEEERAEGARSAKLQRALQEAFGGRSALWDVWAPMRGMHLSETVGMLMRVSHTHLSNITPHQT